MAIKYSEEEKKEIIKTLDVVLDDLEEIWALNIINSVAVPVKFQGISEVDSRFPKDGWLFCIDETGVYMTNAKPNVPGFVYAFRNKDGSLKRVYNVDEREVMLFREYDYIREEIMKKISAVQEQKEEDMGLVRNLRDKYQRQATVKISLPETINQHELMISRREGKTVGRIDFGPAVIELITSESIRLVYEDEKTQPKTKQK